MKQFLIALALLASSACAPKSSAPKPNDFVAGAAGDNQQRSPAPGTPAWNPGWYAATDIYFDPQALATCASDSNTCTQATCTGGTLGPCLTPDEFIRRYGSTSPTMVYGQNIVWHKLSAQNTGNNPIFFSPRISGGGYAAFIDTLVPFYSSDGGGSYLLGTVTQLNQTAGTDMTISNMPAGTTAGMYIFDSTAGGYAFVESMSGSTATMTSPLNTSLVTTIALGTCAVGTAWSTGDTATIYNIPNLSNLKEWRPTGGDVNGSVASLGWVQWTQIADSSGSGLSEYQFVGDSASNILSGVYVAPRLHMSTLGGRQYSSAIFGSFLKSPVVQFTGISEVCGSYLSSTFTVYGGQCNFGANSTINGSISLTVPSGIGVNSGGAHFNGNIALSNGAQFEMGSPIWGAAGISVGPFAGVWVELAGGSWAADFLTTGTNILGAIGTGSRYVGSGVNVDGIPVTQAALIDAGTLFDPYTAGRFTIGQ